jgi:hypothetical protein
MLNVQTSIHAIEGAGGRSSDQDNSLTLGGLRAGARAHAVSAATGPACEAAAGRAVALGHEPAALGAVVEAAAAAARAASSGVGRGTSLLDEDFFVADVVGVGGDCGVETAEGGKLDKGGILHDQLGWQVLECVPSGG